MKISNSLQYLEKHQRKIVTAICLFIALSGVVYSYIRGEYLPYVDERDYVTIAKNIIRVNTFTLDGQQPTAYRPPGYPILLSFVIAGGMGIVQMRILNFVLLSCTVALLYGITKHLHKGISGVVAAILVCCYPVLFYTAGTLVPQTLGAFLLLLALWLLVKGKGNVLTYLLVGVLWGIQVLAIPSFVFVLGIFFQWPFWQRRTLSRVTLSIALVLGTAIVISPWTMRNYSLFGKFVPVSTNSGQNLLMGNNENAEGASGATVDIADYWKLVPHLNEAQQDSALSSKAVDFIRSNPAQSIKLYVLKFLNYFGISNDLSTQGEFGVLYKVIMMCTYWPLLFLLLLRLLYWRKIPLSYEEFLFATIYIGSGLFYAIYFTRIRFRLPFDFLLIALVSIFIIGFIQSRLKQPPLKQISQR